MPQGSILGVLLSMFHMNDMHNVNPKFHAVLFADDMNLTSIENLITQLILNEQTIEWVTESNFLGLTID